MIDSHSGLVLSVESLTRRFGSGLALDNISLHVERGSVFGLIGENGAGKTTLIRHLLGLWKAQTGTVRVFGLDPVLHPVEVLGRIGYLSEERDLPDWMSIRELMKYVSAFFPSWDATYAEELRDAFELDRKCKVKNLSRGQRARAGLLIALAHRPELLILDEPSTGLDPIVRRDILGAIIRTIADEGRTVLFSSHLLDEVERVADQVAILHQGKILLQDSMESLSESYRRLVLRFESPPQNTPLLQGAFRQEGSGDTWTFDCQGNPQILRDSATSLGAKVIEEGRLSLEEIFVSRVTHRKPSALGK